MNGGGGNGNGSAIDTQGIALTVTSSTFSGDLVQGGAGGQGQGPSFYAENGFGGAASGTINVSSYEATSSFTLTGDAFTNERVIGGAGANNSGPGFIGNGGDGGYISGVIDNYYGIPDMSLSSCSFTDNLAQAGAGGIGGADTTAVSGAMPAAAWSTPAAT